jgi:ubiquinone/menaquinone biosynthesis C-methylase UbiE
MIHTIQNLEASAALREEMESEYIEFVGDKHAKTSAFRGWEYHEAILVAGLEAEHAILDVGCASSHFGLYVADKVDKVYGIDHIETYAFTRHTVPWMESLRDFSAYRNGDFVLVLSNAAKLPFADSFFDRVFTFSAMEHFLGQDDSLCAREVRRVLKVGGLFLGTVDYNPTTEHPTGEECVRTYTHESLWRRIIRPSGLSLIGTDHEASVSVPDSVAYLAQAIFFALRKD